MSISEHFTESFTATDLPAAVDACATAELEPLVVALEPPVLEAGCGSGKWMHYLKRHGITAVGIDWSEELQRLSQRLDADVRFDIGDLRQLPYDDHSFGGVVALGSIEHVEEGPQGILAEFRRVLRPSGTLLVTVPYRSWLKRPRQALRQRDGLRRATGRPPLPTHDSYRAGVFALIDADTGFFQYEFTPDQLREELKLAGFAVERLFLFAKDFGLYQALGGSFDMTTERATPRAGLSRVVPSRAAAHMIGALATPAEDAKASPVADGRGRL